MKKNRDILESIIWAFFIVLLAVILSRMEFGLLSVLVFGLGLGYILQRSRFCIASAYSDLVLFKEGKLFRALIIFILISTLGFTLVELSGDGQGFVVAVGGHTILGAILFGCGMVLAGGCAAGTLMRLGEGYILFIPVLVGLIGGSTLGAYHYNYWGTAQSFSKTVFIPDAMGWPLAVGMQICFLIFFWLVVRHLENK
ncbi:MAG: YeeE/YedE thiosulfate transporter family protein [Desulfitobacteriaceae bacterium]|nr:YeeE/YedE thiosulfate transporter family protein [Desulfitobacteriaceae bacterium]